MARKISLNDLLKMMACKEQVDKFRRRFPSGSTTVTRARVLKYASVFDWKFGRWLLDYRTRTKMEKAYATAEQGFHLINQQIGRRRDEAIARAWGQFMRNDITRASYDRYASTARSVAYTEYQDNKLSFRRACAIPFYEAYNGKL